MLAALKWLSFPSWSHRQRANILTLKKERFNLESFCPAYKKTRILKEFVNLKNRKTNYDLHTRSILIRMLEEHSLHNCIRVQYRGQNYNNFEKFLKSIHDTTDWLWTCFNLIQGAKVKQGCAKYIVIKSNDLFA